MTELEIMQRAKMYMDKLAQGIDPVTDTELPDDSALNNVRLARCFFYVSGVLQQVINNKGVVGSRPKKKYDLTPEMLQQLNPADHPIRITEFMQMLAAASGREDAKRPAATVVTDWLLEKGFLEKQVNADGKTNRIPSEAGRQLGIEYEIRQGQYGDYPSVTYSPAAQAFLIDHLAEIFASKSE